MEFAGVTAVAKANVYFDGGVISHTILSPDGARRTLGIIRPGTYHFGTEKAERMEITDGACEIVRDGSIEPEVFAAGTAFEIPAKSGFSISVDNGLCQYVCSFLD